MISVNYGGKYQLFDDSDKYLIRLGDFRISKTWSAKSSLFVPFCKLSFDYKNIVDPFSTYSCYYSGYDKFTVKRMIVIQMK